MRAAVQRRRGGLGEADPALDGEVEVLAPPAQRGAVTCAGGLEDDAEAAAEELTAMERKTPYKPGLTNYRKPPELL